MVVWHPRTFVAEDLDGQFLVYAATDDREVNARIYRLADQANRVANAVDDLDHCNFIAPAVAQAGVGPGRDLDGRQQSRRWPSRFAIACSTRC